MTGWLRAQVSLPTQYNGKTQDPVGALSGALARLQANRPLRELREIAKGVTKQLPEPIQVRLPFLPELGFVCSVCTLQLFLQKSSISICLWLSLCAAPTEAVGRIAAPADVCTCGFWERCLDAGLQEATAKIDEYARGMISGSGSTLFEELGLYYIGPIDGHNLDLIIAMLQGLPSPMWVHRSCA